MSERSDRQAALELSPAEFRSAGHALVDRIADLLGGIGERPVTSGEPPSAIRRALGGGGLPAQGTDAAQVLDEAVTLLGEHSLFNGHPRFWGYITSSAAPIGVLGDMLAAAINPNVGAWKLSPMASEIEAQTVRWIAELIGYPTSCGGLLVSGGNVANIACFLAARCAKASWNLRGEGVLSPNGGPLRAYISSEGHTWMETAADVAGFGTDSIRWVETDAQQRMSVAHLESMLREDAREGDVPAIVVATAGTVATGAIDPLAEIAALRDEHGFWMHIDGAYGAFAAAAPGAPPALKALASADSIAVDPHKWLYAPLEAGCVLVREAQALADAFRYHPSYYKFDDPSGEATVDYYAYGLQNSRGFRALKVWLALRHAGRDGYARMIADDMALAERLYARALEHPRLEACTQSLSITTFRYVPAGLDPHGPGVPAYLDGLNEELVSALQQGGEAFVSNAVVNERYLLRACVVNFRSTARDIDALPEIVARIGGQLDAKLRSSALGGETPAE